MERMEKAQHEETASMLNLVKALKELKGMDLEQIRTKVETLKSLSELSSSRETIASPMMTESQVPLQAPKEVDNQFAKI